MAFKQTILMFERISMMIIFSFKASSVLGILWWTNMFQIDMILILDSSVWFMFLSLSCFVSSI